MKLLKRILKSEAGQALPMALVLLVLGGLLVIPTLAFMTTNLTANRIVKEKNLATYAADAGVEDALWNMKYGTEPPGGWAGWSHPHLYLNGKDVNTTITNVGSQLYKITSIAISADGKTTTIDAYVSTAPGLFDYALLAIGDTGPTVSFTFGGGSGAAATATVAGGVVTGVTVTKGGSGYTSPPTVTFLSYNSSGAAATASVAGGVVTGVTVTNGGSGYTSDPNIIAHNGTVTKSGEGGVGVLDADPHDPNKVLIFANGKVALPGTDVKGHITATSPPPPASPPAFAIDVYKAIGNYIPINPLDPTPPFPAKANGEPFDFGPAVQSLQSTSTTDHLAIDPAKFLAQNVTPPADFEINHTTPPVWTINTAGIYPGNHHVGPGDCLIGGTLAGNVSITMEGTLIVDGKLTTGGNYDQTFKGPVWVKGGPSHDKITDINAKNFNGNLKVTTFEDIVYIEGNLDISSGSTINFNDDVYVTGYIHTHGVGEINFNRNLYVGGAHLSLDRVMHVEGGNLTFGGIVFVDDPRSSGLTYKSSAHNMNVTGGGPIIIKNNLEFEGGDAALDKIPLIMSENGYIKNTGGGDMNVYLYAPHGLVHWGSGTVTGGITGRTVEIASGVIVTHALLPGGLGGGSGGGAVIAYSIQ